MSNELKIKNYDDMLMIFTRMHRQETLVFVAMNSGTFIHRNNLNLNCAKSKEVIFLAHIVFAENLSSIHHRANLFTEKTS